MNHWACGNNEVPGMTNYVVYYVGPNGIVNIDRTLTVKNVSESVRNRYTYIDVMDFNSSSNVVIVAYCELMTDDNSTLSNAPYHVFHSRLVICFDFESVHASDSKGK